MKIQYVGPKPYRKHATDAGSDLTIVRDVIVQHGQVTFVSTGVAVAIPENHVGYVIPRSGLGTKHGLALANTIGVIDSDFRGEIELALTLNRPGRVQLARGSRVAQLVIQPIIVPEWVRADRLDETERGDGGFGSTGT